MKNLFITGINGFIGSSVAEHFLNKGYHVIGLVRDFNMKSRHEILNKCSIVRGDILDKELLQSVLSKYEVDEIIHLASQPIVRICDNDPYSAYMTNVVGVLNLLESVRVLKKKPEKVICMTCYDEQTRALTSSGFKSYKDIKIGEKILSINPETKELEETEVEDIIVADYSGEMISFNGKSIDLLVTPNHKMILEDKKDNKLKFIQADTEIKLNKFGIPYGKWVGDEKAELPSLPDFHWNIKKIAPNPKIEDVLYLLGIYIGDGCIQQQEKTQVSKTGLSAEEYVKTCRDKNGRFVKNNYSGDKQNTTSSNVVFLYIPRKDDCRPRLEACLDRLGVKFSNWNHGGEGAITFSSAELIHWLKDAGTSSYTKKIPRWALSFTKEKLEHLLDGIIDSDGHRGKQTTITTVSEDLISGLVELGYKCGHDVSFYKRKQPEKKPVINGREVNTSGGFTFILSKQNKSILPGHKKTVNNFSGRVWCLKLKKNKNFIVERNGRVVFCGNSDKAYGPHEALPYKEEAPLVVADSYCTSKACQDMVARSYANTYNLPIVVVRAGNIYGPGDLNLSRLIPNTIRRLLNNEEPMLYSGVAEYIREFIYISNVADAYETLLEKGIPGEAYNIGGTKPQKIKDVITLIRDKVNPEIKINIVEKDFYELKEQYLDGTKLLNLGFKPKVDLEEGVELTIKWFKENVFNK